MNIQKAKCFEDDEQLLHLKQAMRSSLNLAITLDNKLDRVIEQRKQAWQDVDKLNEQLKAYQHG